MASSSASESPTRETINICLDHLPISLSTLHRKGSIIPTLFLHGFGGTKEDYADVALHPLFHGRPFLAYDAPGCGESRINDLSQLSMPLLVTLAEKVLSYFQITSFHLVGHSMGGLVATLLAHQRPSSVVSYVNIKGNLAPEDCFLSRQILDYPSGGDAEAFMDAFVERTRGSPFFGSGVYAASLRAKVQPGAVRPIFRSMVDITDDKSQFLMKAFRGLELPRMYMYGEQFAGLSYLEGLKGVGVELAEIPYSGHFVMYTNPVLMWERIAEFITRAESGKC